MFTITNGKTMQYTVACFDYSFANDWEQDLFEQQLADIGFEAFSEGEAYIQTTLLDLPSLQTLVDATPGVAILDVHACEDANWNAAWDAEHADQELALGVHITPCCAFGAGHHETTSMMIEALLDARGTHLLQDNSSVLDMGCGTGVLGIMAKRCGAGEVLAVDIDDKSVDNARDNALRNGENITVQVGSVPPAGQYHLILANIHRNILIDQLPAYAAYLLPQGVVWLSGFYAADIPTLVARAQELGLSHITTYNKNEWCMLRFIKQ